MAKTYLHTAISWIHFIVLEGLSDALFDFHMHLWMFIVELDWHQTLTPLG